MSYLNIKIDIFNQIKSINYVDRNKELIESKSRYGIKI